MFPSTLNGAKSPVGDTIRLFALIPIVSRACGYRDHLNTQCVDANQITPANVHRLETAWTYYAGGADPNGGKIGTKSGDAYIAFALPE